MNEINDMVVKCKEERVEKVKEVNEEIEKLLVEPIEQFE